MHTINNPNKEVMQYYGRRFFLWFLSEQSVSSCKGNLWTERHSYKLVQQAANDGRSDAIETSLLSNQQAIFTESIPQI